MTFRLKYHQVKLKSAIYAPSQDEEHSRHFYTGVTPGFTKPLLFLPIFRWLKLKLTPKEGHTIEDIKPFFVKFFMHIPKQYLNGQISGFLS